MYFKLIGMGRTELNKYVFSLVGISVVVLIGLVAIIMGMQNYLSSPRMSSAQQPTFVPSQAPSRTQSVKTAAKGFPKVAVAEWGAFPASPAFEPPQRATLYALKQQYSRQEFANLAQHFISVNGNKVSEKDKTVSVVTDKADVGLFYLYKPTGTFFYRARTGLSLPSRGANETEKVSTFMRELWNDGTLQVTGSYEKRSVPGIRYYEVHRDWDRVGMPIMNLIGTFNIAGDGQIGKMSLLEQTGQEPDSDIIKTDNKTDGLARNTDFNTATVGITEGRIVSVTSNIRPLAQTGTRSHGVIPYEDAVAKLRRGSHTHLYVSPAGGGGANPELVYDNNSVVLKNVEVGESLTAYLEELPNKPQTQLYPYFIFKGMATTDTGYRVKFVASVPALANSVLGTSTEQSSALLSQRTGFNASQQQGTLEFMDPTNAPIPALSQTPDYTPAPTANPQAMEELVCDPPPSPRDLSSVTTDPGGLVYGIYHSEWHIIPGGGWHVDDLAVAVEKSLVAVSDDSHAELLREIDRIIREFESISVGCPVRITGVSAERGHSS